MTNNHSYIIDSKNKEDIINQIIINNSSININGNNITSRKAKKIYNRHKSTENEDKYIRNKPLCIIKKIFLSNNNNNSLINTNKKNKEVFINNNIKLKKMIYSNNNSNVLLIHKF